jgi:hypothetical protein
MATDIQQGVFYGEPISGDPEIKVTRQRGLDPARQFGTDRTPPAPVIQGDANTVVSRNAGPHVTQRYGPDGTLFADAVADTGTVLYLDHRVTAIGEANQPPGIERTAMPLPPPPGFGDMVAVQQREAIKAAAIAAGFTVSEAKDSPIAFGVIASDGGSADDRDRGDRGPQVFSASDLPVVRKMPIVPVVLPTPKTRRVKAKAAPKGKK